MCEKYDIDEQRGHKVVPVMYIEFDLLLLVSLHGALFKSLEIKLSLQMSIFQLDQDHVSLAGNYKKINTLLVCSTKHFVTPNA